jgi:DNA-directed RNA polymerase subunit RPC12/RpoP
MQEEALYKCSECGVHIWPSDRDLTSVWYTDSMMYYLCPKCNKYCDWEEVGGDVETVEMFTDFSAD